MHIAFFQLGGYLINSLTGFGGDGNRAGVALVCGSVPFAFNTAGTGTGAGAGAGAGAPFFNGYCFAFAGAAGAAAAATGACLA